MLPQAAPLRAPRETASAALFGLGGAWMLAAWETTDADPPRRLDPRVDGAPAARPCTTLTLRTSWGGHRTVALLRRAGPPGAACDVRFDDPETGAAVAEGRAHGALPDADARLLLGTLDAPGRLRLARLLLDFGRSAPGLRTDPSYVGTCRAVVQELSPRPSDLAPRARLTERLVLCAGTLSGGFGEIAGAWVFSGDALVPAPLPPLAGGPADAKGRVPLHLAVDAALCGGDGLAVVLGRTGLASRRLGAVPADLPDAAEACAGSQALRRYVLRCLSSRAPAEPAAGAALREIQVLRPLPPLREASLGGGFEASLACAVAVPGGVFASGRLRDPDGLAAGLALVSPFGDALRLPVPRTAASGRFALFAPAAWPEAALQVAAEVELASGARIALVAPARPLDAAGALRTVLAGVAPHEADADLIDAALAPATAPLLAAARAAARPPDVREAGPRRARPVVSVLVPGAADAEHLRALLARLALEPETEAAEVLVAGPDHLADAILDSARLHALPLVHLATRRPIDRQQALAACIDAARGREVLVLSPDALPASPGWIAALRRALADHPAAAAAGARVLDAHGGIVHAGADAAAGEEGAPILVSAFAGLPGTFPPALAPRAADAVSEACLLVRRDALDAVGGPAQDDLSPDADGDLCLRLRAAGKTIRYVPDAAVHDLSPRRAETTAAAVDRRRRSLRWAPLLADLAAGRPAARTVSRPRRRRSRA
jgi:hypothetical protein